MPLPQLTFGCFVRSASHDGARSLRRNCAPVYPLILNQALASTDSSGRSAARLASTMRGFRIAEHHADLLADLVDEDDGGFALGDRSRELSQRLAHQAGLQAHVAVAHFAFDLSTWNERGDGVDDDDLHGI